jgi:hypothetical protein
MKIRRILTFLICLFIITINNLEAQDVTGLRIYNSSETTSLTKHGITWTFDTSVEFGQYINGDYWVLGPISIINIFPQSSTVSGRTKNGSEINPNPNGTTQGYDSGMLYNTFDQNLNVGLGISEGNPLVVNSSSSLVSTISNNSASSKPQLLNAAVLTVVGSVPPDNSFRPPFAGSDKTSNFAESDINTSALKNLSPTASTPSWDTADEWFRNVWLDYRGYVGGRMLHPSNNMPDYGREISTRIGEAAIMLNLDYSLDQKRTLLIYFLQYGIDLWGVVQQGFGGWYQDGGHGAGRKFPLLFAGVIFNNTTIKDAVTTTTYSYNGRNGIAFGEDQTTFYLTEEEAKRYLDGNDLYPYNNEHQSYADAYYTVADWSGSNYNGTTGIPEYGKWYASAFQGRWISRRLDASYRECCHVNGFSGFIMAAHIMGLKTLWNHDALFDYADRYLQWTQDSGSPGWHMHNSQLAADIWNTYRSDYPPIWNDDLY